MIHLSESEMKILAAVFARMHNGCARIDYDSLCAQTGRARSFVSSCLSQFVGYRILRRIRYATYEKGPMANMVTNFPVPDPKPAPSFRATPGETPVQSVLPPSSLRQPTKAQLMAGRA